MSRQTKGNLFAMMDDVLQKVAAVKKANPEGDGSEPTSHPLAEVDAGTTKAQEGERSAENDADIKEEYGDLGSTGQEDANTATSEKATDSIGTQSQEADEVKGNVQTPKAEKDDPEQNGRGDGSPGHPSNLTFNEKYSAAKVMKAGEALLRAIVSIKQAEEESEEEDEVTEEAEETKTETEAKSEDSQASEQAEMEDKAAESVKRAAAEKYKEDAQAGYVAAQLLARQLGFDKKAEDEIVTKVASSVIKKAEEDADVFCSFLAGHAQGEVESTKKASAKRASTKKRAMGEGGLPPELMAALAGGGGGGGMPPEAMPAEAAPPPEMMGMGGGGGGGGGEEEALLQELATAMAAEGITPEDLVEAASGGGDGGGGEIGGGGEVGGMPPELTAAPAPGPAEGSEAGGGEDNAAEEASESEEEATEETEEGEKEGAFHRKQAALLATLRGLMRSA
jgi:hypothetical protein